MSTAWTYLKKIPLFAMIVLIFIMICACDHSLIKPNQGSLILTIPQGKRSTAVNDGTIFQVTIAGTNGMPQRQSGTPGQSIQFSSLNPDTYAITVEGTKNDELIYYGTASATVTSGSSTAATVDLSPIIKTFAEFQKAVTAGGVVYVGGNFNYTNSLTVDKAVTVMAIKETTLTRTGTNPFFIVESTGSLTLGGGKATLTLDGASQKAYGIQATSSKIVLKDNIVITKNKLSGIHMEGSNNILVMDGGSITNTYMEERTSGGKHWGGGVYISGENSSFVMNGGEISNNRLETPGARGAGVYISGKGSSFVMNGGEIKSNRASAVKAPSGGYVSGVQYIYSYGGGVYVDVGTFTMNGGSISNNTASATTAQSLSSSISGSAHGGGVYATNFIMQGGLIKGNNVSASTSGGGAGDPYGDGVYVSSSFSMKGGASITDNDVYLPSNRKIIVAGTLTAASPVATITLADNSPKVGTTILEGNAVATEHNKFTMTDSQFVIDSEGKLARK